MNEQLSPTVTGVILAGGQARRMGGNDKGLLLYQGKPLVSHVMAALQPQVDSLIINANRNLDQYQSFSHPVVVDSMSGFHGPLAGMLAVMQQVETDFILCCPCDCPHPSSQLRSRLLESLLHTQSDIAVATDGERVQPVFCLIRRSLAANLAHYLEQGGRKVDDWFEQNKLVKVSFADQKSHFINFNHPDDIPTQDTIKAPVPLLGFAAFSGTGKTTLLTKLLPELKQRDIRIAVVKHAHHNFDIDKPGKDSYRIREAGAQQMLIASSRMMALMQKSDNEEDDPSLAELLTRLDYNKLDLVLVEGFKHEVFPKIELHRPSLGHPLLLEEDNQIIAIATDSDIDTETPQLNLNQIEAMADFIQQFMHDWSPHHG
jgi:molybdenum cofactor guanylyltransferase/molybdopterin-guanine dinucleotide biosynthesis protein MobB